YGLWQCVNHCHQQTYSNEALIRQMVTEQKDMKIPEDLIPYCPKCGAGLEVNKRTEEKGMVEDAHFHAQKKRYEQFLNENKNKQVRSLEICVRPTTPKFSRQPLQQMTEENSRALLLTMNQKKYFIPHAIRPQTVKIDNDIASTLDKLTNVNNGGTN